MTAATRAMPSDMELVRAFVRSKDHDAFAQLVRRHVDMVYATALRRVRDRHLADDVTQATFVILADRARTLDERDRKSTRLNSSHSQISYAVFCWKKIS